MHALISALGPDVFQSVSCIKTVDKVHHKYTESISTPLYEVLSDNHENILKKCQLPTDSYMSTYL